MFQDYPIDLISFNIEDGVFMSECINPSPVVLPIYSISSTDSNVNFNLEIIDGSLFYNVYYKGEQLFKNAKLGLKINGIDYSSDVAFVSAEQSTESDTIVLNGRFSNITTQYNLSKVMFSSHGQIFILEIRIYNNGVAFRMLFDSSAGKTVNAEYTEFSIDENSYVYASFGCRRGDCQRRDSMAGYHSICYEALYDRFPVKTVFTPNENQYKQNGLFENSENFVITPMTIEFAKTYAGKQYYGAILEGNVADYVGVNIKQIGGGKFALNTTFQPHAQFVDFDVTNDRVITPYRILTLGESLDDIYNNCIVYSVNEEPSEDHSWVIPGKSTWSWRSNGGTGNMDTMYAYSDAAAKMGFEYNLVDAGWPRFEKDGGTSIDAIRKLCADTKDYGVKQIIWNAFTVGAHGGFPLGTKTDGLNDKGIRVFISDYDKVEEFCIAAKNAGVKGLKLDFMVPEDQPESGVNFYERTAEIAQKYGLIINYHGASKPSGLNRTHPNILNYEGIFGHEMQYAFTSFPVEAQLFTTQYITRGLAGHADYTPHVLNGLGLAELVFVDAPLNVIDAKPEELLNSRATEFIKAVPSVWDTTKVLSCSVFGEYAAIARCKDGNWYLGAISAKSTATDTKISLDEFLTDDGEYILDLYTDSGVSSKRVRKNDVITLNLAAYSGCAARISKAKMSCYGGQITSAPLTIELTDGCIAYYSTSGNEPTTSSAKYSGSIDINSSCVLKIIVVNSSGKTVSKLSYRFNKI